MKLKKMFKSNQKKEGKRGKKRKTRSYFRFQKYKTTLQAENIKTLIFLKNGEKMKKFNLIPIN